MESNVYKITEDIKLAIHTEEEDHVDVLSGFIIPGSFISLISKISQDIDICTSNMIQSAACIDHIILPLIAENILCFILV